MQAGRGATEETLALNDGDDWPQVAYARALPMSASIRPRRASAALLAATLVSAVVTPLSAQPEQGSEGEVKRDPVAAEALWKKGRKLRAEGRIHEACPKFVESYRLDPAIGTLLNMASCHELEGRTATAWSEYREAEDVATREGDEKRRAYAKMHADELEGRIPHLTVTIDEPVPDLVVTRDGVPMSNETLGTPLPIDPGDHVIAAKAPGYSTWTARVEASTGKQSSIHVPVLTLLAPETPDDEQEVGTFWTDRKTTGVFVGGIGLAAIGVGAAFGVMTGSQVEKAEQQCPNDRCNAAGHDAVARANTFAWISNIGFGVGAVGVVIGSYLLLTKGSEDPDPDPDPAQGSSEARWSVAPVLGPTGGGVAATVAF